MAAGAMRALRGTDGAVVQGGSGCEWFLGVFSEAALPIEEVVAAARKGALGGQGPGHPSECHLKIDLPQARSLVIIPVTR